MSALNDQAYYVARIERCRRLALMAENPAIGSIHEEFARRYERLLDGFPAAADHPHDRDPGSPQRRSDRTVEIHRPRSAT